MKAKEFFDLYFKYVEYNTESAFVYHRWALIGAVGTVIAKKVQIPMGHLTLYTNLYLQIIGKSGTRKSSAINIAVGLLKKAGHKRFAPKRCSKEAFLSKLTLLDKQITIKDLEDKSVKDVDVFDCDISEVSDMLIAADEFNAFLGSNYDEFLEILSELYDMPDSYDKWLQKGSSAIAHPYVTILSGNTPSGFKLKFKGTSLNQGILTRFIIIPWHKTRCKIAFPQSPNIDMQNTIVNILKEIGEREGVISYTDNAYNMLSSIYTNWKIPTPIHMEQYVERRYTHLLRLCAIFATVESDNLKVTTEIVLLANTILASNEKNMATVFRDIFDSQDQSLIRSILIDRLQNEPKGLSLTQIYNLISVQVPSYPKVVAAIDTLMVQGAIFKTGSGAYLLKREKRDTSLDAYINLDVLTEEERATYEKS